MIFGSVKRNLSASCDPIEVEKPLIERVEYHLYLNHLEPDLNYILLLGKLDILPL